MLIRECSDLHIDHHFASRSPADDRFIEAFNRLLEPFPEDHESVLIIAGDLAPARSMQRIVSFISHACSRFKFVIYVLGNHEHYGSVMDETLPLIKKNLKLENLIVVGNEPELLYIDGVYFLLGTLWTDYNGPASFETHAYIKSYINDHRMILNENGTGVQPDQLIPIHEETVSKFDEWLSIIDPSKAVIVTHHMPSFSAVDPKYLQPGNRASEAINHAFATDLDWLMLERSPAYWCFGHTHTPYFGKVGDTQLICNPFGYPGEDNLKKGSYSPRLRFEL